MGKSTSEILGGMTIMVMMSEIGRGAEREGELGETKTEREG